MMPLSYRFKIAAILAEAAELIDFGGHEFACLAISTVESGNFYSKGPAVQAFRSLRPSIEHLREVQGPASWNDPNDRLLLEGPWWDGRCAESDAEERVLLLLLAAQMALSGDLDTSMEGVTQLPEADRACKRRPREDWYIRTLTRKPTPSEIKFGHGCQHYHPPVVLPVSQRFLTLNGVRWTVVR